MDESDESTPLVTGTEAEAEIQQLLGLFDSPAFVRRGYDLESALERLRLRLDRERFGMLDMVRLRLRQWAAAATGPDDFADVLRGPVGPLWTLIRPRTPTGPGVAADGPTDAPTWASHPAPSRRRRVVARDLVASVARFNLRWSRFLGRLTLENVNRQIDQYNRYYVLEKECVLGSARLAARYFEPKPRLTLDLLLDEFPLLPVPELLGR